MGLGSEIRDPEKTYSGSRLPDPGVKKAPDPGSRIRYTAFYKGSVVQELWTRDAKPVYGACMSYNRFAYLLAHLRMDDRSQRDALRPHDKFAPAR
jgi:hypothetical protein